jgi:hypothetical protein
MHIQAKKIIAVCLEEKNSFACHEHIYTYTWSVPTFEFIFKTITSREYSNKVIPSRKIDSEL